MTPSLRHLALPVALFPALVWAQSATPSTPEQLELAERFLDTAHLFASAPESAPVASGLADLSTRLIGATPDPRLLRLNADLQLKLGNVSKASELLTAYRRLDGRDELAQVQAIDLFVASMQSADDKEKYLRTVFAAEPVAAAVRSHAGVLLYGVLSERARDDEAVVVLNQALVLNPANPKALQRAVERAYANNEPAPKRGATLVNLLLGNPLQPASIFALGEELMRAGANDEALAMYRQGWESAGALGVPPEADDAINAAALTLASAKPQDALSLAAAATQLSPSSSRAWFMRVLAEKELGDEKTTEAILGEATAAITRNLMALHRLIDEKAPEVTSETAPQLPDVRADADELLKRNDPRLAKAYLATLDDLAWLSVYFAGKPADPTVLAAIDKLAGENSAIAARLQGYTALAAGQLDEATVKFNAIAQQDAMARLGLLAVRLKKNEPKPELLADAQRLLAEMPTDVWSATLRSTLKPLGAISFSSPDRAALVQETARLPQGWLNFARTPNNFYLMELRPVKAGIVPGEPVLMSVRLQNTGTLPLVIGPGGPIDQTVAIDISTRGAVEQYLPGVAGARLTGRIVLPPNTSMVTLVRIDGPALSQFLSSTVHVPVTLFASAVSNARVNDKQNIVPGPGGFRRQAESPIDRPAMALANESVRNALAERLRRDTGADRLIVMRVLSDNLRVLQSVENPNESVQQLIKSGLEMLQGAVEKQSNPAGVALGKRMLLDVTKDPQAAETMLAGMLKSSDWESRALATLMSISLPQAKRTELLTPLASDADEAVKQIAVGVMAIPDPKPADPQPTETPKEP